VTAIGPDFHACKTLYYSVTLAVATGEIDRDETTARLRELVTE